MNMNVSSLILSDWLLNATDTLARAGIGTARLDCLVLLEDATGKDRAWLLAHPEYILPYPVIKKLEEWLKHREKHEPLAYIRGKTEFYGREYIVGKKVLEPRPESETMIELLKELIDNQQETGNKEEIVIVDVGTGSGAIGITAALEIPNLQVILTDIDPECLKIARVNTKKYGVKVNFLQGDLLEPLIPESTTPYTLLANLPYVPDHYEINEAAMMEPRIAIFGGSDGLDLYRRMFDQVSKMQHKPEYIFTESLPFQHMELKSIAETAGYILENAVDFIQLFSPDAE